MKENQLDDSEVPNMKPLLRIGANGVQPVPYTNYKGETKIRNIMPITLYFGSNEWHTEEQWLLIAWDSDKKALRTFALKGFEEGNKFFELSLPTEADFPKGADTDDFIVPTEIVGTAVPKPKKPSIKRRGNKDALEKE